MHYSFAIFWGKHLHGNVSTWLLKSTLDISYHHRPFYSPDFAVLAARPAALSNFFTKLTHNSAVGFARRSPMPGSRGGGESEFPKEPERHWATRPNYDGIYEPLRRAPRKISNLDIYLLRPRAAQTGPSRSALSWKTFIKRAEANDRFSNYSSTVAAVSRHFSW